MGWLGKRSAASSGEAGWARAGLVAVVYLGLAVTAVGWGTWRGHPDVWRHPDREPLRLASILAGVAAGLAIVFASRLALYRCEWARALHRDLRHLLFPLSDLEIVALAGASSVGEEMFFRGALLPAVGLWTSSAIFALLHIGPKLRHLPWTVSSLGAGILFGAMFIWTGDLTGPVVAHFLVNFLNLRHVAAVELR